MATVSRLKAATALYVPQSQSDCAKDIKILGELRRESARAIADMNDEIGKLAKAAEPKLQALEKRIVTLQKGVQIYCEAHRAELTGDKLKSANLVTGTVGWKFRPPSVRVSGVDAVIAILKKCGLERFVRTKEEINKEAILNEQEAVRGVAGITIQTDIEDFYIEPFEVQAPEAA